MAGTIRIRVGDLDIDVETAPVVGSEPTSKISRAAEGVLDAFAQAQEAIVAISASVADMAERTAARAARPDHLEVTFGLKVSAQGNVIVAGAAGEATLEVKVVYDAKATAATSIGPAPPP